MNDNIEKVTLEKALKGIIKPYRKPNQSDNIQISEKSSTTKEKSLETKTMEKYDSLKKDIKSGRVKNYYINKEGDIIQKVTVHLPIDMVTRLKKEAIDQRVTLSELIRSRLKQHTSSGAHSFIDTTV
jgi:hypothetical protein